MSITKQEVTAHSIGDMDSNRFKTPDLSDYVSSTKDMTVDIIRKPPGSHGEEAESFESTSKGADETHFRDDAVAMSPDGADSKTSNAPIIDETILWAKKTTIQVCPMKKADQKFTMIPGSATSTIAPTRPKQYFVIHNSWSNKVLDVTEDDTSPGTYLIIYQQKTPLSDNQLWYKDENGYICSKLTGYYIDTSKDGYARLQPRGEANVKQHWVYHEDDRTIRNEDDKNKVLDIRWDIKWNCNKVIEYDFHNERNQRWELRKVDI